MDIQYWTEFYRQGKAVEYPSPFAVFCLERHLSSPSTIVELGAGNGRDAIAFARAGHTVIAVDQCPTAIAAAKLRAANLGLYSVDFRVLDFAQAIADIGQPDAYYARFSLHAVSAEEQRATLQNASRSLVSGGRFFVEARTVGDDLFGEGDPVAENAFVTDHYRRFIEPTRFARDAAAEGFRITYMEEGRGFAPFGDEDPMVMRAVLQRS